MLRKEDLPFKAPSRRFAVESFVKKICFLKLCQEDLPFKAPSRRFAFSSVQKICLLQLDEKICLLKVRKEDLPLKASFKALWRHLNGPVQHFSDQDSWLTGQTGHWADAGKKN